MRVASLTKENIGEGVGVNGVTTRLRVNYEPGSAQGPASLVLKLPAALPGAQGNRAPARVLTRTRYASTTNWRGACP